VGLTAAAPTAYQVNLAWTDNATNETGFLVERLNGAVYQTVATLGAGVSVYSDPTVQPGTAYSYRVVAFNGAGSAAPSNTAVVSTPPGIPRPPSGLTAAVVAAGRIRIDWLDNSSNETSFRVERSTAGGPFGLILVTGANTVTYTEGGLSANTTYAYRVSAANSLGVSAPSGTAQATTPYLPPAPSGLVSATVGLTVRLNWQDNSPNEDVFLVRRAAPGGDYVTIATLPPNTVTFTDPAPVPEINYYYFVRASNLAGFTNSNVVRGKVP